MTQLRVITFTVEVTVPAATGESEVAAAVNAALDEPPCDWGEWEVGPATIAEVRHVNGRFSQDEQSES